MARSFADRTIENLGESEVIPFKYSITSYGADFPVDGLVKRIKEGGIYIPSFQRSYVWKINQASRFIESLLLGLPVPGIFLAREQETQKLLVIDGQQRLRTLQYFYDGIMPSNNGAHKGSEFALRGVQVQFQGATYESLADEDRRGLDNYILHATIFKQDEPSADESSIYYVFERLNTGATQLQPQEIRACIYHGEFNELLRQLNRIESWRSIYGPVSPRLRDQELILRFLALYFEAEAYKAPMKEFLNEYMGKSRHLKLQLGDKLRRTFLETIDTVFRCLGARAFRPKTALNAAVFDAVMVGVARRLEKGPILSCTGLTEGYQALLSDTRFATASERATADEESVGRRIALATQAFADT